MLELQLGRIARHFVEIVHVQLANEVFEVAVIEIRGEQGLFEVVSVHNF